MDTVATAPNESNNTQAGNPSLTETTSLDSLTDSFLAGELSNLGPVTIEDDPTNPEVGGKPAHEVNGGTGARPGTQQAPAQPAQPAQPGVQAGRNYKEVFGDQPVPKWAKEMSNDAWSNFVPVYQYYAQREARAAERKQKETETEKKLKELENSRYYDLEEGWRVDPEFRRASDEAATAEAVRDHWAAQLANIEAGNDWVPAVKNAEGKWVTGAVQKASIEGKVQILSELTRANSMVESHRQRAETLSQNFKARQQEFYNGMEELRTSLFSRYEKNIEPFRKSAMEMFTEIIRHKPEVKALADAIVLIKLQGQVISKLNKQVPAAVNGQAAITNLQPSSTAGTNGGEESRKANVDKLARMVAGIE